MPICSNCRPRWWRKSRHAKCSRYIHGNVAVFRCGCECNAIPPDWEPPRMQSLLSAGEEPAGPPGQARPHARTDVPVEPPLDGGKRDE